MSDWRDVMEARADASATLVTALRHADSKPVRESGASVLIAALTFSTSAICAELRALGTTIDYAAGNRG